MLRITRLTDYGFVLLGHIAGCDQNELHNSKDLSSLLSIPLPTVSKVLKSLVQAGLLDSHQGSQGGYKLSKSSDDISAADIIEILEDLSRDLNNYDLEFRIQELESKFSKDLSEATFNELKELKKKQNIN